MGVGCQNPAVEECKVAAEQQVDIQEVNDDKDVVAAREAEREVAAGLD